MFKFWYRYKFIRTLIGGKWWHIKIGANKVWRQSSPNWERNEIFLGGEIYSS